MHMTIILIVWQVELSHYFSFQSFDPYRLKPTNMRNTEEACSMRDTILPQAIILTKAHRQRGVLWPAFCL